MNEWNKGGVGGCGEGRDVREVYEGLVEETRVEYARYCARPTLDVLQRLVTCLERAAELCRRPLVDGCAAVLCGDDSRGECAAVHFARHTACAGSDAAHPPLLCEAVVPPALVHEMHAIAQSLREHPSVAPHLLTPFLTLSAPPAPVRSAPAASPLGSPENRQPTTGLLSRSRAPVPLPAAATATTSMNADDEGDGYSSFGDVDCQPRVENNSLLENDLTSTVADEQDEEEEEEQQEEKEEEEEDEELGEIRDWTREFQEALDMPAGEPEERLARGKRIRDVADAFARTATALARRIVAENSVPGLRARRGGIVPEVEGGVAGGKKFLLRGIFFKFAVDRYGLYGGDHWAMKAANHELLGLTAYFNCSLPELHFPLMAVIDYCGFRLTAISELPIDGARTLCYGSADGGATVRAGATDTAAAAGMRQAGAILNLRAHVAGTAAPQRLCAPCDIEVHRGTDDRLYVLDTARVFPPEPPVSGVRGAALHRLLRPELVRSNPVALSPDAFSAFARHDAAAAQHEADIHAAHQRLLCEIIPSVVLALNQRIKRMATNESPLLPSVLELSRRICLPDELHREGINIRYLDRLKHCDGVAPHPLLGVLINTQIVARQMKRVLRERLRFLLRASQVSCSSSSSSSGYSSNRCIRTHNGGDGSNGSLPVRRESIAEAFNELMCAVRLQCLARDEAIDVRYLLALLDETMGLRVADAGVARIVAGGLMQPADVVDLVPCVRYTSAVPYQEGVALYYQATTASAAALHDDDNDDDSSGNSGSGSDSGSGSSGRRSKTDEVADALLAVAEEKFDEALRSQPDAYAILTHWGILLRERARLHRADRAARDALLNRAMDKFAQAVRIRRNYHYAISRWGELLEWWAQCKRTVDHDPERARQLSLLADTKLKQARVFGKRWFFGTLPTNGIPGVIDTSFRRATTPAAADSSPAPAHSPRRARTPGQPRGFFFIRSSNNRPGHFVFTLIKRDPSTKRFSARHIIINETPDGRYYTSRDRPPFDSLEDFVVAKIQDGYEPILRDWAETE